MVYVVAGQLDRRGYPALASWQLPKQRVLPQAPLLRASLSQIEVVNLLSGEYLQVGTPGVRDTGHIHLVPVPVSAGPSPVDSGLPVFLQGTRHPAAPSQGDQQEGPAS